MLRPGGWPGQGVPEVDEPAAEGDVVLGGYRQMPVAEQVAVGRGAGVASDQGGGRRVRALGEADHAGGEGAKHWLAVLTEPAGSAFSAPARSSHPSRR